MSQDRTPPGVFYGCRILLAPMAGVTDSIFRMLCLEQGADLAYCEMVSAKGLSYSSQKTRQLIDRSNAEPKVGVQLFGHEPHIMADQAAWIESQQGDGLACIDINMGCPARKIVSKGDGASLLRNPDLACKIARSVKEAVSCPVTVKMRRGFTEGEIDTCAFARKIEQTGVDAITVHPRYATQFYSGTADWDVIRAVKEAVCIPVIGNGDIHDGNDALRMTRQTNCDAVMVGRAAEGNPWVFSSIRAALAGEDLPNPPSLTERIALARRHALLMANCEGTHIVRMRKHAIWYVSGIPGASRARRLFNDCTSLADFTDVFDQLEEYARQVSE